MSQRDAEVNELNERNSSLTQQLQQNTEDIANKFEEAEASRETVVTGLQH